jgi:serine phosphatase RsbU (regulator of sigma subunit)
LFYGILDRSSLTFRFATAGGLRPMIWRGGKLASLPVKNAPPLNDSALGSFPENEWSLEPGDYLVLVTRGLEPIAAPKSMEAWIEARIRKHDNWPDMQDIQNELAAVASDMSALTDDITLLQLTVDPRALYLKK